MYNTLLALEASTISYFQNVLNARYRRLKQKTIPTKKHVYEEMYDTDEIMNDLRGNEKKKIFC